MHQKFTSKVVGQGKPPKQSEYASSKIKPNGTHKPSARHRERNPSLRTEVGRALRVRTSFLVHALLQALREEDVAELAQPVRLPGRIGSGGLGIEVVPVDRVREEVRRTRDGNHAGVGAFEQRRHQQAGEPEVPFTGWSVDTNERVLGRVGGEGKGGQPTDSSSQPVFVSDIVSSTQNTQGFRDDT